jgi:hypothetical protein
MVGLIAPGASCSVPGAKAILSGFVIMDLVTVNLFPIITNIQQQHIHLDILSTTMGALVIIIIFPQTEIDKRCLSERRLAQRTARRLNETHQAGGVGGLGKKSAPTGETFIPECNLDGRFAEIQVSQPRNRINKK